MSLNYEKTLKPPNSISYLAWALNQIITTSFLTVEGDRRNDLLILVFFFFFSNI
jgi:hypothetical protein